MNYLAHMFLSCSDEEFIVGNFISDFITNKDIHRYSTGIQNGITLHRTIDSFTDTHPLVHKANALIRDDQGKYAPVVTDIYFDHFLITNWDTYSNNHISEYTRYIYDILDKNMNLYPAQLQSIVPVMINDDFLMACENEKRLRKTFQRVANRARFKNNMNHAYDILAANYHILQELFTAFFPELIQKVKQFCGD